MIRTSLIFILLLLILLSCGEEQQAQTEKISETDRIIQEKEANLLAEYNNHSMSVFELPEYKTDEVIPFSAVQKIVSDNCLFCHKPNGNAPFTLMDYKSIQKRAQTIREVLSTKRMPPWLADDSYSHLFNAPKITDQERALIVQWIDQGAKKFGSTDVYTSSNEITPNKPTSVADLELFRSIDFTITTNNDSYECFIYELDDTEAFYLSGVEFISSNPEVIHHQMLYLDTANVVKTDNSCWDCKNDGIINKCVPISSWSKGMRPFALNEKLAYKIPKGSRLILQTHYGNEGNKGRKENTRLRLFKTEVFEEIVEYAIINKFDIFYPKNELKVETLTFSIDEKTSILGITPHAHFLAKKMEVYAICPDKKIIPMLKIPEWDYLWQGDFLFDEPLVLPKGSLVVFSLIIDNTASNPTQPNYPVRDVKYGTNSPDEMLVLILIKKPYKSTDDYLKVARYL
jgi:hypothetical protein